MNTKDPKTSNCHGLSVFFSPMNHADSLVAASKMLLKKYNDTDEPVVEVREYFKGKTNGIHLTIRKSGVYEVRSLVRGREKGP